MNARQLTQASFTRLLALIFGVALVVRVLYAALAPLSFDFFNFYMNGVIAYQNPTTYFGIYTLPMYMYAALYGLWLHIPIVHPAVQDIVSLPEYGGIAPYYHPTPEAVIFVLIMKLPSLTSDLFIGWLIYKILSTAKLSNGNILFGVCAWLLNPVTMILSNYNGVDSVGTLLIVLAAYCARRNSSTFTSISLAVGGLFRLLPFIVIPFFLVKSFRSRDLKGLLSLALPIILVIGVAISALYLLWPFAIDQLLSVRPGLVVPEAIDVLGANFAQQGVEYPGNSVTLAALGYIILLWLLTGPDISLRPELLALAPLLAYTAFSWSLPTLTLYVFPFAFIQMAFSRGQKGLTVLLSVTALLWSIAHFPTYFVGYGAIFYYPLYTKTAQDLAAQLLANLQILNQFFQVQIRGAFSGALILLASRLVHDTAKT